MLHKKILRTGALPDNSDFIYPFTTENLTAVFNNINLDGKKVLIVRSSDDQAINCIYNNAKEITTFDINPLTKIYFDLKLISIKLLTYEEFLAFFGLNHRLFLNNKTLSYKTFTKIYQYLSDDSKMLWEFLYNIVNQKGSDLRSSDIFDRCYYDKKTVIATNPYLKDEKSYNLLKKKIDNVRINHINTDLLSLSNHLRSNYDYIYLSNIAQTIYQSKGLTPKEELYNLKKLINYIANFLNNDGTMVVSYIYHYGDLDFEASTSRPIYKSNLRNSIFYEPQYDTVSFLGIDEIRINGNQSQLLPHHIKDAILTLKK